MQDIEKVIFRFLKDIFIKICMNGDTCLKFKKTLSRPVTCLPLSLKFSVVAMVLKAWETGLYIFLCNYVITKLTKALFVKDKKRSTIINKVMSTWIAWGLGTSNKLLIDKEREFNNACYVNIKKDCRIQKIYLERTHS